jgi:hypothetical protein
MQKSYGRKNTLYEILKIAPQTIKVQTSKPFGCIGVKIVVRCFRSPNDFLLRKFFGKQLLAASGSIGRNPVFIDSGWHFKGLNSSLAGDEGEKKKNY